jgi:serine/threonine-protein kinase RsbW
VIDWIVVSGAQVIQLEVPGTIGFRDVLLRTISAAVKLLWSGSEGVGEVADLFGAHVVSAVGEAFNNIALHGYKGRDPGVVRVNIEMARTFLRIRMEDFGRSFDPNDAVPPQLETLPESGLGVFIMKSFMDEITYTNGQPNVLTLLKRVDLSQRSPARTAGRNQKAQR